MHVLSCQDETTQRTAMMPDQVQYYFQLAQQHQAALSQTSQPATNNNTQQTQQQPQQIQLQGQARHLGVMLLWSQVMTRFVRV